MNNCYIVIASLLFGFSLVSGGELDEGKGLQLDEEFFGRFLILDDNGLAIDSFEDISEIKKEGCSITFRAKKFTLEDAAFIVSFSKLESVEIGRYPEFIVSLEMNALKVLSFSRTIESLGLCVTSLMDDHVKEITRIERLNSIDININPSEGGGGAGDNWWVSLTGASKLNSIRIWGDCKVGDDFLKSVRNLKSLRELAIPYQVFSNQSIDLLNLSSVDDLRIIIPDPRSVDFSGFKNSSIKKLAIFPYKGSYVKGYNEKSYVAFFEMKNLKDFPNLDKLTPVTEKEKRSIEKLRSKLEDASRR